MKNIPNIYNLTATSILKTTTEHISPNEKLDLQSEGYQVLIYLQKGVGTIEGKNNNYSLSSGQLLLLTNENSVRIKAFDEVRVFIIFFRTKQLFLDKITNYTIQLNDDEMLMLDSINNQISNIDFLTRTKPTITFDKEIGEFYNLSCSLLYTYFEKFLLSLIEDKMFHLLPPSVKNKLTWPVSMNVYNKRRNRTFTQLYKNTLVNDIVFYMKENIHENFTIEQLSQIFFISSASLKKIFKKETGLSIMAYFKNIKMEEAIKMIRDSSMSYTDIAHKLGFNTIHHFSSSFKKHTGYSPSKYYESLQPNYQEKISEVETTLNQGRWRRYD